jgi:cytochrome c oxidase cbb3-type subunit 3
MSCISMKEFQHRTYAMAAVFAAITTLTASLSPAASAETDDLIQGRKTFHIHCLQCHGQGGVGGMGPNLTDEATLHGGDYEDILNTVTNGVDGKPMRSWKDTLTPERLEQVARFVHSLKGTRVNGRTIQE